MKYLISFFLLCSIQSNWVDDIEDSISRINKNGKLESEFVELDDYGKIEVKKYGIENDHKITAHFKYDSLIDFNFSYYANGKLVFAEIANGKDIIIHKRERQKNEPYAVLSESVKYFKNENTGISKSKKIYVYENSDIEKLKIELKDMKFEVEKISSYKFLIYWW